MSFQKVIIALDVETADDAIELAKQISPIFPFFKIGSKLFTRFGPELVRGVMQYGRIFLDLKFYDIPSVVAAACAQAARLGVSLVTVHASGGSEMMQRCVEQTRSVDESCRIIAVTVLTSIGTLEEFGISRSVQDHVALLAELAYRSKADGIVCSPVEVGELRGRFPGPFLLVTPGIRGSEDQKGDQKRTASASEAIQSGADYVVIGRPIIAAADPILAARRIAESL